MEIEVLNGKKILEEIIENSKYESLSQVIASHTIFTHPDTVKQTENKNIFKIIRNNSKRGQFETDFMYDDNNCVSDLFCWANGLNKSKRLDVNFNHIYDKSTVIGDYTNLCNIIVTPNFIAKLTDTDKSIKELLKYRAYHKYNYNPDNLEFTKPKNYDALIWREFLPVVPNLKQVLIDAIKSKPENRAVKSINKVGWYFGT